MKAIAKLFREKFTLSMPLSVGVTKEAEAERDKLVQAGAQIKSVSTAQDNESATRAGVDIQTYVKAVESFGLEFRRPLTEAAKLVKQVQDDHLAPLVAEKERIGRLLVDFRAKEQRRVAEEERKRREEFEAREAERKRLEREAEAAAELAAQSGKKRDATAAEKLKAKAEEAEASVQEVIQAPLPEVSKARGSAVKRKLRWEVEDVKAVYAARPELCSLEIKPSAVQALCVPEMPVPGLRLWWEDGAVFSKR